MDINSRKPEEVIRPEFVQQYEKLHENIWHRLVHINTSIQILEALKDFPFERIYATPNYWAMVYWDFIYTSVVMLHAIVNDNGKKTHTLLCFKNKLLRNWFLPKERKSFQVKLTTCKFTKEIDSLGDRIATMRREIVAHALIDKSTGLFSKVSGVSVSELRKFYNSVHQLFEVCCFGGEFKTSLYIDSSDDQPQTEDIDEILKLILKNSAWIKGPERHADFWPDMRQDKSKEEIDELNRWRRKIGLPDA